MEWKNGRVQINGWRCREKVSRLAVRTKELVNEGFQNIWNSSELERGQTLIPGTKEASTRLRLDPPGSARNTRW